MTEQGKRHIQEALEKREKVMEFIKKEGGNPQTVLMTFGRYDVIEILELPSDEVAMKLSIKGAETGDVSIETLRAFTVDEMQSLVSSL
ncbi:hypothetical protein IX51_10790 [uncultured archaeon]|nr:hypothetical protein IX51_10790 [uncultured archaeon]